MSKQVLYIQLRTDQSTAHEEKCILEKSGLDKDKLHVINVLTQNSLLPKPNVLSKYGAVITGAAGQFDLTNMQLKYKKVLDKLAPLYKQLIDLDIPTLAICFGHQLMADILGGEVKADKSQAETGTTEIVLTSEGSNSAIFSGIPNKLYVICGHKDSVTKLPKGAVLLASSANCTNHAYRIGQNVYGVQFHPELNLEDLIWRLNLYPEYMNGRTIQEVKKDFKEIPYADRVLKNFVKSYLL